MKYLLYSIHICFILIDQIISTTMFYNPLENNNNNYSSTTTSNNNNNQNINILSYERQALYDLYISTNGNDWIYQEGDKGHWNFTDPNVNPCLSSNIWQGLNCTIKTSLSTLDSCYYISEIMLPHYNLNGFIPDSIGNFSYLKYLNLYYNTLYSTIPYTIVNLSKLIKLVLAYNSLSGTLPTSIYVLLELQVLDIDSNYYIQGTLSNLIGQLSQLHYLDLRHNSFKGTIPSSIGNLSELYFFSLTGNQFTGKIPKSLSNLTNLNYLGLGINQLSGTIPSWIGELSLLTYLYLYRNKFSGSIPSSISKLKYINILSLSYNQFYGTIPSSLSNLTHLEKIYFENNYIIGSIPNIFQNLNKLSIIELNDNYLTGELPDSLSQLQLLSYLFLENNHFSSNLNNVFNGSYQKYLNNIQLSNNQFTGKLPEQIFLSQSIVAFSAASNCFHGSIPSGICNNINLETLALDGLVCASSCRNKIIPSISSAYVSDNEITGGIPKCLWSMPNLTVLHLSGNSLTGSLPDNINIGRKLVDLSLSYNILTGTIPSYIQMRVWDHLDLSYNRISGTLRSNYASQYTNASLSLKNNRLSGNIPKHLQQMRNISILEGNYYDCKYDRSDLPTYDENKDTYECGSNVFNILYYLWLGLLFLVFSSIVVAWYYRNDIDNYIKLSTIIMNIRKWISITEYIQAHYGTDSIIPSKLPLIYFKAYNTIQEIIHRFSLSITVFVITIILPIFLVISAFYSTQTYEYFWKLSIFYLSGEIAFGIVISILILFVIIQLYIFNYCMKHSVDIQVFDEIIQQNKKDLNDEVVNNDISSQWKIYSTYFTYILINFIIVGGVNIAYVYVVLYRSNMNIALAQILLSIFKMFWNSIISPKMVYWIINYLSIRNITNRVVQRRLFILQFVVSLLNNILIPCLIVAIISPNCFYSVLREESEVTSSFTYKQCYIIEVAGKCIQYDDLEASTSYNPPYNYNYQCSSDFVIYYASVFVLMCLISTFLVPFFQITIIQLSLRYHWINNYIKLNKLLYLEQQAEVVPSPLLAISDIYEFLVSILTMVGLLLTFGVVFPPLAVVFLLAIYRRIYYHKSIIGRYISHAMECKAYSCLDIIEEDCKVIPLLSTIQLCGWILLYVSCLFYTLFVFDILGDDVGVSKAYWALIVMPCIPLFMYMMYKLITFWFAKFQHRKDNNILINNITDNNTNTTIDNGIELSKPSMISNPLFTTNTINNTLDDISV